MSFAPLVLSVVLLTTPAGNDSWTPALHSLVAPKLQALAVHWEILDPRELRYILTRPEDLSADLQLLLRRYQNLADAPSLDDCLRFPDRAAVNDLLAFNRAYRQHLDVRKPLELSRWWEFHSVLQETEQLYRIWDAVRDARCEYYYVTIRREALKQLREMVGPEVYYSGQLPPPVPVWRFETIE
jgi:hypothetical protein